MKAVKAAGTVVLAVPLFLVLVVAAIGGGTAGASPPQAGIDPAKLPALARAALPQLTAILAKRCPNLPAVWLVAQIQAESSWNPRAWADDRNGGTAGLLQINQANWTHLGGQPWTVPAHTRPGTKHGIWTVGEHLDRGAKLACRNLKQATGILADHNPEKLTPIQGMLVCHNAGCGHLAGGKLGKGVRQYVDRITAIAARYAAPGPPTGPGGTPPPVPPGDCGVDKLLPRGNPRSCTQAIQWAIDHTRGRCDWYQLCLKATANAYGYAASGTPSAIQHWQLLQRKGLARPGDDNPPPGALVYWQGGQYGHVALYLGDGKIASNDIRRHGCLDIVTLQTITQRWPRYHYLGWTPPYYPGGAGRERSDVVGPDRMRRVRSATHGPGGGVK